MTTTEKLFVASWFKQATQMAAAAESKTDKRLAAALTKKQPATSALGRALVKQDEGKLLKVPGLGGVSPYVDAPKGGVLLGVTKKF